MSQIKFTRNEYANKIRRASLYTLTAPLVPAVIILTLLFLLGFTNLITNSSILARILFVLIFIPTLIYALIVRIILRIFPRVSKHQNKIRMTEQKDQEPIIRDVEYTQKF